MYYYVLCVLISIIYEFNIYFGFRRMFEYYVKEIKGHMIENEDIIWLDCNIHNGSNVLTFLENNIKLPILRYGYRRGSNMPLYAITEGRTGCTSLNRLFKIILLIRMG